MHPLDRVFRWILPAGGLAVLATVAAAAWFTQPDRYVRGYAPAQPIPFSHALHAGSLDIPCGYCHSGASRSRSAGIPSVETCMGCHRNTRTDHPAIRELTRIHDAGLPLRWNRVHTLPDHVFFDHRPHVNAGIPCQACHGEVEAMATTRRRMAMRMANCLGCHRDPHDLPQGGPGPSRAAEHCAACHR